MKLIDPRSFGLRRTKKLSAKLRLNGAAAFWGPLAKQDCVSAI